MSTFVFTGRHLSWLACLLLALQGPTVHVYGAEELSSSVKSELLDLSRAFRAIDQSYQYRGMSSRLASTAGSMFVNGEAKGISPKQHSPVIAPAPVLAGCAETDHCSEDCECHSGHHGRPQLPCSDCRNGSLTPLHGSGSGCIATIGVPLHPRCNDCAAAIGSPLHPQALTRQNFSCQNCPIDYDARRLPESCDTCAESTGRHDCFVVEEYRNGHLTRTLVPRDSSKIDGSRE